MTGKTRKEVERLTREAIDLWLKYAPMSFEEAKRELGLHRPWLKKKRRANAGQRGKRRAVARARA